MDAIIKKLPLDIAGAGRTPEVKRPSQAEAEAAVRTLIAWAGEDPDREGLRETPKRVIKAYQHLKAGGLV